MDYSPKRKCVECFVIESTCRFFQPSEEFMVLPGSTGTPSAKSDKTDGSEKTEEREDSKPSTESQSPPGMFN